MFDLPSKPSSKMIIDNIEDPDLISLSKEEAKQLYNFLSKQYIGHEEYPLVHDLIKEISRKFSEVLG